MTANCEIFFDLKMDGTNGIIQYIPIIFATKLKFEAAKIMGIPKKVLFLPVILEYFAVFGTFGYFVYLILTRMRHL